MKKALVGGLVIALLAVVPVGAATITVGDHLLNVRQGPVFSVPIMVSGGEEVAGMDLIAHVGPYAPPETDEVPKLKELPPPMPPDTVPLFNAEMLADTIWGDLHDGGVGVPIPLDEGGRQLFVGSVTVEDVATNAVADGVLARLLIDVSDLAASPTNSWPLCLGIPSGDQTELLVWTGQLTKLPVDIVNGSITLIPEPTTLVMLPGLLVAAPLALVWRRHRRRTRRPRIGG